MAVKVMENAQTPEPDHFFPSTGTNALHRTTLNNTRGRLLTHLKQKRFLHLDMRTVLKKNLPMASAGRATHIPTPKQLKPSKETRW